MLREEDSIELYIKNIEWPKWNRIIWLRIGHSDGKYQKMTPFIATIVIKKRKYKYVRNEMWNR
jgi:hypothetical protein